MICMNDISDFEHEQLNKYSAYIVLLFFYCVFAYNGVNYLFLPVSDNLSALMSVLVLAGFWICFMRVYPKFMKYYRLAFSKFTNKKAETPIPF